MGKRSMKGKMNPDSEEKGHQVSWVFPEGLLHPGRECTRNSSLRAGRRKTGTKISQR